MPVHKHSRPAGSTWTAVTLTAQVLGWERREAALSEPRTMLDNDLSLLLEQCWSAGTAKQALKQLVVRLEDRGGRCGPLDGEWQWLHP